MFRWSKQKDDAPVWNTYRFTYTPVTKVNYQVEPACAGSNDGFDKLTLEILTNGTIIQKMPLGLSTFGQNTKSIYNLTEIIATDVIVK